MQKTFLIILALALVANINCEVVEEENVMVLTEANFDGVLAANQYILVEFYAPWCGHCKTLAPEYAKAAATLKTNDPAVALGKVDATEHKALGSKFGVQGFPTLKWFVNGVASEYNGGRTEDTIVQWVKKKVSPSTVEKSSVEDVDALTKANKVVGVFFGAQDSDAYKTFLDLSKAFDDVTFAHVFSADVRSHFKAAENSVVLFRQFDEPQVAYDGEFTLEKVSSWVSMNSLPTVMDFDQSSAQKVFGDNLPCLFLLTGSDDASTAAKAALIEASKTLKGQILMSSTQVADGLGKRLGEYIGVTDAQCPTVRIVNPTKEGAVLKFEFSGEITAESLTKFYNDWAAGSLTPAFKSEEVPATQDKAVYVLVGKEFNKVVKDTTKDVLVEFYAPWCGHCKSLAPIYEELATKLKSQPSVVIAAMDATANEAEGVNVEGFPTIKYYPSNNKDGVDYKGGRTLDDFYKYLKENASVAWVEEAAAEDAPKNDDL